MGRPHGKPEQVEKRRLKAIELVYTEGKTAAEAARTLKIHDRTIRKWLATYRKSGKAGLVVKVSTGRPKKLTETQLKKLQKIIIEGPKKAGFLNDLWTSKRVLQIIKSKFDIEYHANHLPKLLRCLGFSTQRPQREAVEKNPEDITNWIRYEWRRIKKKPGKRKPQ